MQLYRRLDDYLHDSADGSEPVTGTFSVARIGMIWLAANFVVTTLLTGTLFLPGVKFSTALVMIVLGTLGGAVVLVTVGRMGTHTGLATMALTRASFGQRGSALPLVANVVVLMGWSWVQAMLAGITVDHVVHRLTGFSSPVLFSVLCQALVVVIGIFGHHGIAKIEPWLALLMLAITAWIFVVAFTTFGIAAFQAIPADPTRELSAIGVLDIVIATAISWTVLSADFNRFARTSRGGVIGSGLGYASSTIVSMTLGLTAIGYVILRGGEAIPFDPTVLVVEFGMPLAAVIFVSVMATNSMVVYGMVTSVITSAFGSRLRFLPTALVLGAISIIGATWLGLLSAFTDFLLLIGALFVPIFAIMIADFYLIRRGYRSTEVLNRSGGAYWYHRGVNWAAVLTCALGTGFSVLITHLWVSPVGATIPTFALSFGLYLAARWSGRTHQQAHARR